MDHTKEGMQLEEGKYYLRADGCKSGPAEWNDSPSHINWNVPNEHGGFMGYHDDGRVCVEELEDKFNLIAEWTEEPAEETGTLKELTVKPGDVVECVQSRVEWWTEGNLYVITKDGTPADNSGSTYGDCKDPQPAVKFRIISRASDREEMKQLIDDAADDIQDVLDRLAEYDTPKTSSPEGGADYLLWGEMTDEEKGALLLAHHEGKVIEVFGAVNWHECQTVVWYDNCAYRVRPEPKRETWELWMRRINHDECKEQRVGTIQTADGKPDCDSIKMEEIND